MRTMNLQTVSFLTVVVLVTVAFFWLMLPFLMSIVALILVSRRATYPQALMQPYRKGER